MRPASRHLALAPADSGCGLDVLVLGCLVRSVMALADDPLVQDGASSGQVHYSRGGMACNTLSVASALGLRAAGIVACGEDADAEALRSELLSEGVRAHFCPSGTTPSTVTLSSRSSRFSVLGGEGRRERDLDRSEVLLAYEELGLRAQWLFLTLPALVSPSGHHLSEAARAAGAKVAVTLSSAADVLACGEISGATLATVDLVLGNAEEFSALRRSGSWSSVAVETLGEDGAMVHEPGSTPFHVPLPSGLAPPLVDATGAGDAFAAGVIAGLSIPRPGGRSLASAVELGQRAASVIVAQVGTSLTLRSRELLRLLGSHHGVAAGR